ncbi:dTDP-4-dehydrorhamnose 3,5-epimerase family protein [Kibdelosporangium phytohabitans]|uniref:dTDP-4-dehydrorhamnose 3,5-epimerase n=1 Tax=Kibdelosporangium phytohabitans TaxID=860235 RepID=A0A0N9HVS6_9PSEU|nr:dTDP-4-dehydrorhamnose 3,5-epimerase family protein [Kibdelosporangium phytohabitans]ALG09315.1 dTDP-4-dehydrorhamnose 3,5-epimerase [Kibdelosporangium phytohabitans]
MESRPLRVDGAFAFTPPVYRDDRGFILAPFQETPFVGEVGYPLFPVVQTCFSKSRRGVVRGVHYTATPPGMAKYVYCAYGTIQDVVVDLRVGSPTYGAWDSVVLDQDSFQAVYLPVGVGHAFVSLADDSVMHYMLSAGYSTDTELAISPLDLDLPLVIDANPVLSERDAAAPAFAAAERAGLLPHYDVCQEIEAKWRG